jgi:hypothetical protein
MKIYFKTKIDDGNSWGDCYESNRNKFVDNYFYGNVVLTY